MGNPYAALFNYRQFILWRYESRDGKQTKVPCDLTGSHRIKVTDPSVRVDYLTALGAAQANGLGLGFVLTDADPFALIDIDKCISPAGEVSDIANNLLSSFQGALVERSVSGTGFHVIVSYSSIPPHASKNTALGIELYHTERFIALGDMATAVGDSGYDMTAQLAHTVATYFMPRQATLHSDEWTDGPVEGWAGPEDDDQLIELASRERSLASAFGGTKATFLDLWQANVDVLADAYPSDNSAGYDQSSADLALASKLAFYTGHDCERIVRLMHQSELVRDKWEREDYMRGTVLRAAEDRSQFYSRTAPSSTPDEDTEQVRELIEAQAGNISEMPAILTAISQVQDPLLREAVAQLYRRRLKEEKLYNGMLGKRIDERLSETHVLGDTPEQGQFLDPSRAMNPRLWVHSKGRDLKPLGTQENFNTLLQAYGVQVSFDEVLRELRTYYPGQREGVLRDEAALSFIQSLANLNQYPKGDIDGMLAGAAHCRTVNPVTEWVRQYQWDGVDRFPELVQQITFSPEEDTDLAQLLLRKWLRAAVAIGTGIARKMEYVLTLVDPHGGAGKTRFFATLGPAELVKDSLTLDTTNKDSVKVATSCWLAELGELDGTFRRSDQARIKAFLSAHVDEIRLPYGRAYNKYPRRTAFFASVNTQSFLVDTSGNRRFWPIRVTRVNHTHNVNVQQLWAQMLYEVEMGQTWHLEDVDAQRLTSHNEAFSSQSRVVHSLEQHVDTTDTNGQHMTVTQVLNACGYHGANKAELNEAAEWLRRKGVRESGVNGRRGFWVTIQTLADNAFTPTIVGAN